MRSTGQDLGGIEVELVSREIESLSAFASIHPLSILLRITRVLKVKDHRG